MSSRRRACGFLRRYVALSLALYTAALALPAARINQARAPTVARARALTATTPAAPPSTDVPPLQQLLHAAGLDAKQAAEVYAKRPPGRLPAATSQAALLEWLQRHPLTDTPKYPLAVLTYQTLRKAPALFLKANRLDELDATLDALREALAPTTPKQMALTLANAPLLLLLHPEAIVARRGWLRERAGLSDAEARAAIAAAPRLRRARETKLDEAASKLEALGVEGGRLRRVVAKAPMSLQLGRQSLDSRLAFFASLGLDAAATAASIVRAPRLLHTPLPELQARYDWLLAEGVATAETAPAWLARLPDYWGLPTERVARRLAWLADECAVGLSPAAAMVAAEPGILVQSVDQLELRRELWDRVLGGSADELANVPQLFTCDLGRVVMLRYAYLLANGITDVPPTQLLVPDTATFCIEVAGCTEAELRAFEDDGTHLTIFGAI